MEGFSNAFDRPHELVVCRKQDRVLGHKVAYGCHGVAETEWKRRQGVPCGVLRREGDAVRGLSG